MRFRKAAKRGRKTVEIVFTVLTLAASSNMVQAETYSLTLASSHATVLPWVGQLSKLVVGEASSRLEAIGSEDRIEWTESCGGVLYGFKDML